MKHVYSPSNSIEAHMLVHLLEQEEIKAYIHGEALEGAMGELPATNLIRIAVADEDYDRARKILLDWESKNVTPESYYQPTFQKSSCSSIVLLALLCTGVGWFLNDYLSSQGVVNTFTDKIDQNNDGKPDFVYHYKDKNSAYATKSESDRNFDGTFDVIAIYNARGIIESDKADDDFDGQFETRNTYKDGLPFKTEVDSDRDGKIDIRNFYENGIFVRAEYLDPVTSRPVKINYFTHYALKHADFDSDNDGFLETRYTYDRYEQIIKTDQNARN